MATKPPPPAPDPATAELFSQALAPTPTPESALDLWGHVLVCLRPAYQAREYYHSGQYDTCGKQIGALTACLKGKFRSYTPPPEVEAHQAAEAGGGAAAAAAAGGEPVLPLKSTPSWD